MIDNTSRRKWKVSTDQLVDDIVDNVVEIMTRGKMKDDLVTAHTNYLVEFPYLRVPHYV